MSKRAKYNNGGPEHLELVVVKENENGTVDLATDAGVLKVTSCPQCDEPKVGHCLVFVDIEAADDKAEKTAAKKAAAEKAAAEKAAKKAAAEKAAAEKASKKAAAEKTEDPNSPEGKAKA